MRTKLSAKSVIQESIFRELVPTNRRCGVVLTNVFTTPLRRFPASSDIKSIERCAGLFENHHKTQHRDAVQGIMFRSAVNNKPATRHRVTDGSL